MFASTELRRSPDALVFLTVCSRRLLSFLLLLLLSHFLVGCHSTSTTPSIEFTKLPASVEGGPDSAGTIEGHALNSRPGQQIVIYAKSGVWWVQPYAVSPFTKIQPDSTWSSPTHLGTEYAALLVDPSYHPPAKMGTLPKLGDGVVALATGSGGPPPVLVSKVVHFSGYEWKVREASSNRGGRPSKYDPSNAWTDEHGALHLRIMKINGKWTCAEVMLNRSLGYGSYRFVVRDVSHLDPSVVFGLFTWDDLDTDRNHRELDVEISRWSDPASKNAQYVVQPFYVPANVARFAAPAGVLTHSFHWEPNKVSFRTVRGASPGSGLVSEHTFTTGIPAPGDESVHLNLYLYGESPNPPGEQTEVVIEKFEFLP